MVPGAVLWPAAMIVWGPGCSTSRHAHDSVQLLLAKRGTLRVRGRDTERWRQCGGAIVGPRAIQILISFVDPKCSLGRTLLTYGGPGIAAIPDQIVCRWHDLLWPAQSGCLDAPKVETWIRTEFLAARHEAAIHPGINRALRFLRAQISSTRQFTAAELARVAGLSETRFTHVFTESLGVPLRPYILWLRLQIASGELLRGTSATDAAHSAGFSDAAHMSRTFRRMLGTTPKELTAASKLARGIGPDAGS
ncbi:MAG TPA: AraC family transcriptional regulator [Terracidiphilus sp.]|nr:AraC family transcriptional regulator [Terracidiphilus sp.]